MHKLDKTYRHAIKICPRCGFLMVYHAPKSIDTSYCECTECNWLIEVTVWDEYVKGIYSKEELMKMWR